MSLKAGIDVGSTTVKLIVIDEQGKTIYSKYERHYSDVKKAALQTLREAQKLVAEQPLSIAITGSGGMGLAEMLDIPFVQEVIACTRTVEEIIPETDVAIELGGEDAKITFLKALWNSG